MVYKKKHNKKNKMVYKKKIKKIKNGLQKKKKKKYIYLYGKKGQSHWGRNRYMVRFKGNCSTVE